METAQKDTVTAHESPSIEQDDSGSNGTSASGTSNERCKARTPKTAPYKYACHVREDHCMPIFGVQFNHCITKRQAIFATVGSNRVSIYECPPGNEPDIKMLRCYMDPDTDEVFYTCAWSYGPKSGEAILAAAGYRGVIRVFYTSHENKCKNFLGHGQAINELKFHPTKPDILLSASKDHSMRLWNIETDVLVAILGGVEGHRDEVLSVDFDMRGNSIMSAGMDHSLKLWRLTKPEINTAIAGSYDFDARTAERLFPTFREHFPDFFTRDVHRNYVDSVYWTGDFVFSKSCENSLVCWQPNKLKTPKGTVTILHTFEVKDCEIWFVRFAIHRLTQRMALGNQLGKTYLWEFDTTDPNLTKCSILQHPQCVTTIRQTAFSQDANILICVCDDGTIWRWDRNEEI